MSVSRRAIPHLFEHWDLVAARIRASRRVVVFLDFDGTLVRIARRPDRVHLASRTRRILLLLVRNPRVTLEIISGRRRADLQRHIGMRKIHCLGLYGWERSAPPPPLPRPALKALRLARIALEEHLSDYPKVWIENKILSLSVHLLAASADDERRVRRQVRSWLRPFRQDLRCFENLRDVDILPRPIAGKGHAVLHVLAAQKLRGALPIYFGDDFSDEPAFAAVRGGISVLVGAPRLTRARFLLRDPVEVGVALTRLEAVLA
jgi:trehalose 6-phosphate phosphatase